MPDINEWDIFKSDIDKDNAANSFFKNATDVAILKQYKPFDFGTFDEGEYARNKNAEPLTTREMAKLTLREYNPKQEQDLFDPTLFVKKDFNSYFDNFEEKKYLNDKYGYDLTKTIQENEQMYYDDWMKQNVLTRGLKTIGTMATNIVAKAGLKFVEGLGYVGSALNPLNIFGEDYFLKVADNGFSNYFNKVQEGMKDDPMFRTYKSSEYDSMGAFEKMTTSEFWGSEAADGFAFMLSAMIPVAGIFSKIGKGLSFAKRAQVVGELGTVAEEASAAMNIASGGRVLTGRLGNASNALFGSKEIAAPIQWAYSVASESFFETKGVVDALNKRRKDFTDPLFNLSQEEFEEYKNNKASNTFLANAALLSLTNMFQTKLLFKALGKQAAPSIRGAVNNAQQVVAKKELSKLLNNRVVQGVKLAIKGTVIEGYLEENPQLAIERINSSNDKEYLHYNPDSSALWQYFQQIAGQTEKASTLFGGSGDTELATSILLGGIMGGGMAVAQANLQKRKLDKEGNKINSNWYSLSGVGYGEIKNKKDADVFGIAKLQNKYNTWQDANKTAELKTEWDQLKKAPGDNKDRLDAIALEYTAMMKATQSKITKLNEQNILADSLDNVSPAFADVLREQTFKDYFISGNNAGFGQGILSSLESVKNTPISQVREFGLDPESLNEKIYDRYVSISKKVLSNEDYNLDKFQSKSGLITYESLNILAENRKNEALHHVINEDIFNNAVKKHKDEIFTARFKSENSEINVLQDTLLKFVEAYGDIHQAKQNIDSKTITEDGKKREEDRLVKAQNKLDALINDPLNEFINTTILKNPLSSYEDVTKFIYGDLNKIFFESKLASLKSDPNISSEQNEKNIKAQAVLIQNELSDLAHSLSQQIRNIYSVTSLTNAAINAKYLANLLKNMNAEEYLEYLKEKIRIAKTTTPEITTEIESEVKSEIEQLKELLKQKEEELIALNKDEILKKQEELNIERGSIDDIEKERIIDIEKQQNDIKETLKKIDLLESEIAEIKAKILAKEEIIIDKDPIYFIREIKDEDGVVTEYEIANVKTNQGVSGEIYSNKDLAEAALKKLEKKDIPVKIAPLVYKKDKEVWLLDKVGDNYIYYPEGTTQEDIDSLTPAPLKTIIPEVSNETAEAIENHFSPTKPVVGVFQEVVFNGKSYRKYADGRIFEMQDEVEYKADLTVDSLRKLDALFNGVVIEDEVEVEIKDSATPYLTPNKSVISLVEVVNKVDVTKKVIIPEIGEIDAMPIIASKYDIKMNALMLMPGFGSFISENSFQLVIQKGDFSEESQRKNRFTDKVNAGIDAGVVQEGHVIALVDSDGKYVKIKVDEKITQDDTGDVVMFNIDKNIFLSHLSKSAGIYKDKIDPAMSEEEIILNVYGIVDNKVKQLEEAIELIDRDKTGATKIPIYFMESSRGKQPYGNQYILVNSVIAKPKLTFITKKTYDNKVNFNGEFFSVGSFIVQIHGKEHIKVIPATIGDNENEVVKNSVKNIFDLDYSKLSDAQKELVLKFISKYLFIKSLPPLPKSKKLLFEPTKNKNSPYVIKVSNGKLTLFKVSGTEEISFDPMDLTLSLPFVDLDKNTKLKILNDKFEEVEINATEYLLNNLKTNYKPLIDKDNNLRSLPLTPYFTFSYSKENPITDVQTTSEVGSLNDELTNAENRYEEMQSRHKNEIEEYNKKNNTDFLNRDEILYGRNEYSDFERTKEILEIANRQKAEEEKSRGEVLSVIDKFSTVNAPQLTNEEKSKRKEIFEKLKTIWNRISSKDSNNRADLDEGFAVDFTAASEAGGVNIPAHGMGKSSLASALKDLFELMNNGINPKRGHGGLDVAPLTAPEVSAQTTGGGHAYRDGAFILLGTDGMITNINDIRGILVNDGLLNSNPEIIDLLRQSFPNLEIQSYSNAAKAVESLLDKQPQPQKEVDAPIPVSDLEIEIAKIEKRRQEELIISLGIIQMDKIKGWYSSHLVNTQLVGDKNKEEALKKVLLSIIKRVENKEKLGQQSKIFDSEIQAYENIKLINARYNAALAVLKSEPQKVSNSLLNEIHELTSKSSIDIGLIEFGIQSLEGAYGPVKSVKKVSDYNRIVKEINELNDLIQCK